jgi:hypothetical protein
MPFPSIKPAGRSFDLGDYPVKTFTSQSGKESRILYGSNRTGATLELKFDNIPAATAAQFTTHYDETRGTYATFSLPTTVFAGTSASNINPGAATSWRYAEPPAITSVFNNLSSVAVRLVAVL